MPVIFLPNLCGWRLMVVRKRERWHLIYFLLLKGGRGYFKGEGATSSPGCFSLQSGSKGTPWGRGWGKGRNRGLTVLVFPQRKSMKTRTFAFFFLRVYSAWTSINDGWGDYSRKGQGDWGRIFQIFEPKVGDFSKGVINWVTGLILGNTVCAIHITQY